MRILWDFSNSDSGGALASLENFLDSQTFLTNSNNFHILVTRVPIKTSKHYEHLKWIRVSKRNRLEKIKYLFLDLPKLARSEQVDVIVFSGGLPSPFVGIPFFFFVRQALYFSGRKSLISAKERFIFKIKTFVLKRASKKAQAIFVQTSFMKGEVMRAFKPPCKVETVTWNPIQESDEIILTDKGGEEVQDSELRILYVSLPTGRPYKNHEKLIRAFQICLQSGLNARLILTSPKASVSCDPTEMRIFATIEELDLWNKVTLTGILTRKDTLSLYKNADIFCFPSDFESFGVPLVEAMAAGLPILASETAVVREVTHDCGLYFNQHEPSSIAAQILRSVNSLKCLADASRDAYDRYYKHNNIWKQVEQMLDYIGDSC